MPKKSPAPAAPAAGKAAGERADAISAEAAAAVQARSANPDPTLLGEVAAELGIGHLIKTETLKPEAGNLNPADEEQDAPGDESSDLGEESAADAEREVSASDPEAPASEGTESENESESPAQNAESEAAETAAAAPDPLAEIKQQLAELKQQNEELRREQAAPATPPKPLAHLQDAVLMATSVEELDSLAVEYGNLQDMCIENPAGFELPPVREGAEPREISETEARSLLVKCNRILREIPIRARELQVQSQADASALETFPAFLDPKSAESKLYSQLTTLAPQLRRLPNLRTFVGDAVANERARKTAATRPAAETKRDANGKPIVGQPVARKTVVPAVPAPPARATAPAASTARLSQTRELWRKQSSGQGGAENLALLVEAMEPRKQRRTA